jgi:hypothetical protein
MKGFWLFVGYIVLISLWIGPFALLAQFGFIPDVWVFVIVFPPMIGGYIYVCRKAYRHSLPVGQRGSKRQTAKDTAD